ncbi:entericidin A/B family lipoprotein, partial [Crenothrix polyspora]|uniref:entericidin A/B family lipoprotein n=1 Tax=Crenothrix polyspora TaxID=360316 RepID=UPI001FEABD26
DKSALKSKSKFNGRVAAQCELILSFMGVLTACNTIEGAGKDVQSGGRHVEDAAKDVKKGM